jgi:hypothetical protein
MPTSIERRDNLALQHKHERPIYSINTPEPAMSKEDRDRMRKRIRWLAEMDPSMREMVEDTKAKCERVFMC